jgi:hypothetical protein
VDDLRFPVWASVAWVVLFLSFLYFGGGCVLPWLKIGLTVAAYLGIRLGYAVYGLVLGYRLTKAGQDPKLQLEDLHGIGHIVAGVMAVAALILPPVVVLSGLVVLTIGFLGVMVCPR